MSVHTLASTHPGPVEKYYVDTSALLPLTLNVAAGDGLGAPVEGIEAKRLAAVEAFANRARKSGAELRTSLLAVEEIAAKVINAKRRDAAKVKGHGSWSDYKVSSSFNPKDAEAVHRDGLQWLDWANRAALSAGILFERRAFPSTPLADAATRKLRDTYRMMLKKYASLDAMDALHIVVGLEIGASNFISFDHGWQKVAEINVYGL